LGSPEMPASGTGATRRSGCESCRANYFPKKQKWCRVVGKRIRFIDETAEISSLHNDVSDSDDDIASETDNIPLSLAQPTLTQPIIKDSTKVFVKPSRENRPIPTPAAHSSEGQTLLPIERGQPYPLTNLQSLHSYPAFRSPSSGHLNFDDPIGNFSPIPRSQISGQIGSISEIGSGNPVEDPSLPEPRRAFHSTNLPLKNCREAHLVRFYVDYIATPFDFGDSLNRMSTLIPQYAALSPALLNAVLALAAKFHDKEGSLAFFDKPADRYYDAAVESLKPAFNDSHLEAEEIEFAAAVLLRIYQVIGTVHATFKTPTAIWNFLTSRVRTPKRGSLLEAAIWSWIPVEVFRSMMRNEPTNLHLDHLSFDRSLQPADENVWAYRMVLHTIDILNFCFGNTKSPATYDRLASYAAKWIKEAPDSFTPIYIYSPSEGSPFPEILLLDDSVVMGYSYYQLNRILLTIHNPDTPPLSKGSPHANRTMNNEIRADVKVLCGIAESISQCNPAHMVACMSIAVAGNRFKIREEQVALYNLFFNTAKHYYWDAGLM
ncbi:arca-like protein, partial [Colletotrichum incanum]